jgi:thiol-disulfide isomerase/thioredoxin
MTTTLRRLTRRSTVVMATVVIAGVLASAGCSGGSPSDVANQGFVSGDGTVTQLAVAHRKTPVEFSGTTLDGKHFDLAALRGKVVVVNVWASWCPPCIAETPALEAVHEKTKAAGVSFIGVNTESDVAAAKAHERRFGVTYPSIGDDGGRVLLDLRGSLPPTSTPSTLVLDRRGRVAARVVGQVDESTLSSLVADVVAEVRA